ncbi:MAG: hypothetical protein HC882_09175 [Acidobacteria bacterium]|nr:hypothetical protein [Acidobacteriota bacterium]
MGMLSFVSSKLEQHALTPLLSATFQRWLYDDFSMCAPALRPISPDRERGFPLCNAIRCYMAKNGSDGGSMRANLRHGSLDVGCLLILIAGPIMVLATPAVLAWAALARGPFLENSIEGMAGWVEQ